jgi:hypothetical protein
MEQDLYRIKSVTFTLLKAREDKQKVDDMIAKLENTRDKLQVNSDNLETKIQSYLGYWQAGYGKPVPNKKELERMIASVGKLPKNAKPDQVAKAIE